MSDLLWSPALKGGRKLIKHSFSASSNRLFLLRYNEGITRLVHVQTNMHVYSCQRMHAHAITK